MAEALFRDQAGNLFRGDDSQRAVLEQRGFRIATDEDKAAHDRRVDFGGAGQQALAAAEQVGRTASFGAFPGFGTEAEIAAREETFREESPVLSGISQAAGAVVPGLGAGGLALRGAKALGAGARAAGLTGAAAEGLAGGLAEEVEQARYETRDVSVGNVMLWGLGGEIVGRALPKALSLGSGKIRRSLSAVDEAADGIPSSIAAAEGRSVQRRAREALDLPEGPERAAAMADPKVQAELYDTSARGVADALNENDALMSRLGDTGDSKVVEKRLRETMAEQAPVQTEWVTETQRRMAAARQRLDDALEAPEAPSMDEYLSSLPESRRQAAFDEVTDEVMGRVQREGLSPEQGTAQWDAFQAEALAKRVKSKPKTLGNSPGLSGSARQFRQVLETTARQLDETDDHVEWFLRTRRAKQQLQRLSAKMGRATPQDAVLHEELRELIDATWKDMRSGLNDESLFGNAARIEADIDAAWSDNWFKGNQITQTDLGRRVGRDFKTGRHEVEFDPDKVRGFLKKDKLGRDLTQKRLEMQLQGYEDMAAAHARNGTATPEEIAKLRENTAKIRQSLELADEVQVAKAAEDLSPKPKPKKKGIGEAVAGEAAEAALEFALGPIPFAGTILRWGRRILGMNDAAMSASKGTARKLAGVGLEKAERGLDRVSQFGGPVATTALARFTGDYPTPLASFEAKKKLLEDEQTDPMLLYEVLGETLGDLPAANPELFEGITARLQKGLQYLRDNMPAGIAVSLTYPNGIPPSQSDLREWATMWNTVMDPESVYDDIEAGTATPQQMQTLRAVHGDVYDQLQADVFEQVAEHFRDVPTSTKVWLDLLFETDGIAGPMYSTAAADAIGKAREKNQQGGGTPGPAPKPGDVDAGSQARGLSNIASSVTNKGA